MTATFPKMIFGTRPAVVLQVRQRLAREPLTFPKTCLFRNVWSGSAPPSVQSEDGRGHQKFRGFDLGTPITGNAVPDVIKTSNPLSAPVVSR
jgi:hypothetical protein